MTFDDPRARVLTLPYECLESIPEGMSEVRIWHDSILNCERVGKRIDLLGIDESVVPEAATLQLVDHPNVVKVVAAARVAGYPIPMNVIEIVTPFYPLGSVTDALLRGDVFLASEAIAIVRTALLGLEHLHEVHNLCHRDIKSGNILLESRRRGLIADIGLAGSMSGDGTVDSLDNPTLYTPPEFGTSGRVGRQGDVFSMGLVLRELLGGRFEYENYSRAHVVRSITAGRLALPAQALELPLWASASMRRVYRKASHQDPRQRFQNARDFGAALGQVRIADFRQTDPLRWETLPGVNQLPVEVSATAVRGGFRMSLRVDRGSGYRRVQEDIVASTLRSREARRVFDRANTI